MSLCNNKCCNKYCNVIKLVIVKNKETIINR